MKKTFKGWQKSGLDLGDYLTEPCEIDEALSLYIGEVVPAYYLDEGLTQGGDPAKSEMGEDGEKIMYYMTTSHINGKYFFLGILPEFKQ